MGKLVKNALGFDTNLFVYQDKAMFNYSVDTILLGNFVSLTRSTKQLLEIGTNNGALAIFLAARHSDLLIDGVEIQKPAIKIAQKNLRLNNMTSNINLIHADFNKFVQLHTQQQRKKYDGIVCNPPFYKVGATIKKKHSLAMHIATHEIHLTLEEIVRGSAKIIKQKGYLSMVIATERLVDLFTYMRQYGFEPKRVQFIHPRTHKKANFVLVEGRFKVGWGTKFLPNIYLHPAADHDHSYLPEVQKLYQPIIVKGTHHA